MEHLHIFLFYFPTCFFFHLGLIEFIEDPHEAATDIYTNACKIINYYELKMENLTSIGADNTNVNFGKYHSVFQLFKNDLPHIRQGRVNRLS